MEILALLSILLVALPFSALASRLPARAQPFLQPLPALAAFLWLALVAGPGILRNGSVSFEAVWIPQLDISLTFHLNGLGLVLALLVTGIGALILLYTTGYTGGKQGSGRLYPLLYLFMLSMAGLAVADHLIILFIFWELTSISSYLLIGYNHSDPKARRNALQALLVTAGGGMALLAGFILLAGVAGTWSLRELALADEAIRSNTLYPGILVLVLLGALTKSAQFPFHFWLPNAMCAPTPVSAYLHSATMVKAGIFLLFLMLPILGGTAAWTLTLTLTGSITLLLGGCFGLRQHDLKKVLAGTTVAVLGLLTLLLGIGSEKDLLAALLFLLGHALYKATLFMVAGSVDHATGTRDVRILGGLGRLMPWTAAAALLAAFSKMGLPPFFGFLGKEYTYKAGLAAEYEWVLTGVLLLGNAMVLALAIKAAILPFWKSTPAKIPSHVHEAPLSMRIGPLLLAILGILFGAFPAILNPLLSAAQSSVLGRPVSTEVLLWQGFNFPLFLSALTLLVGLWISSRIQSVRDLLSRMPHGLMESVYDYLLSSVLKMAAWQTRLLQNGYLRNYLLIITAATVFLVASKLWRFGGLSLDAASVQFDPLLFMVVMVMLLAIALAVTTKSRLTALLSLGLIGYGIAWVFARYSAPDLAITQILVETLTVVLFAWVVYRLPEFRILSSRRTILTDAIVSLAAGVLVTLLVLKSQIVGIGPEISATLAEWSMERAYGSNVVNVILVDFRALDTWAEICVLAIAGIGVWALTTSHPGKKKDNLS